MKSCDIGTHLSWFRVFIFCARLILHIILFTLYVFDTEGKIRLHIEYFYIYKDCFCVCMYVIQEVEKVTKGKKKDKAKPKIMKVGTWDCFLSFFIFLFLVFLLQNSHHYLSSNLQFFFFIAT